MPDYSVVVVARDHPRVLLNALLALRRQARPAEVLLVDNGSAGDLGGVARLAQLPIRHLRLPRHQSLGAAFNAGLDAAAHDYILLLHGDVLLEGDPAEATALLDEHPEVGVVGGLLCQEGPPPRRVLSAGYWVDPRRLAPVVIGGRRVAHYPAVADVAAVSDACMVVRRSGLRCDERYWFRLEDVDLCFQYAQCGYRVVLLPALPAIHLGNGGATEHLAEAGWVRRRFASEELYHARWCSDQSLAEHPMQDAVRGEPAETWLRAVDASYPSV